jgi:hypothetical protein
VQAAIDAPPICRMQINCYHFVYFDEMITDEYGRQ